MKTVTTVTIALILSFTMLVTGESFQLYLSDFETEFTSVTFYPDAQEGNSAQQMVKDIEHACKHYRDQCGKMDFQKVGF